MLTDNQPTIEERRAVANEYKREWRKKNPEKVRAAQDRYWSKKAAELKARQEAEKAESE